MENNEIKKIVFNNTGLNIDDYSKNEAIDVNTLETNPYI